jgi:hypothetical protein
LEKTALRELRGAGTIACIFNNHNILRSRDGRKLMQFNAK